MMLHFPGIVLATIVVCLPAIESQCVDCSKTWHKKCVTNVTGYFCETGASLNKKFLKPTELATSSPDPFSIYSPCVPYPYDLSYVKSYCCFWSKEGGCQMTLHPEVYSYGYPSRHCEKCRLKCQCEGQSVDIKPLNWATLCCLSMMLLRFI